MEEELVFLLLLGLIFFFVWNSTQKKSGPPVASPMQQAAAPTESDGSAVPLGVVQAVIEKFQSTQVDMVPLETLYFTPLGNGIYRARLMFLNTRHFFGQQFDIQASINDYGAVTILNTETTSDAVSYTSAYQPDSYQSFDVVQTAIDGQLKSALANSKSNSFPIQLSESFSSSFDSQLSKLDLQTRASIDVEKINF
jgi:hypothetical protein